MKKTAKVQGGTRGLLRRLRDIMAGGGTAQDRLDQVVKMIAAGLDAEVCSVYLRRAGDVLELFATQGLKREAVHVTRLRVGEGLVGDIAAHARPLALAEARSHPAFAYRPETGEEIYHSLVGVPILRDGRVFGVLVVQNRKPREYSDDEIETLETIAMVLAELVANGELVHPKELLSADGIALLPLRLEGLRLNNGIAVGHAVIHRPKFVVSRIVAEDVDIERKRLDEALYAMQLAIKKLVSDEALGEEGGEHLAILESYQMFAADRNWSNRLREAIRTGLTAEAAVQKVQNDTRARMNQMADAYFRERLMDLEDLGNRLLTHLAGEPDPVLSEELPEESVIVARAMGPAELLDYDRQKLRGLVLEEGSPTAHVAVVARALGIPVLGRVRGALSKIEHGDPLVLDVENAEVLIRPAEEIQAAYRDTIRSRAAKSMLYAGMHNLPSVTLDGTPISLSINANLPVDLESLKTSGAEGVGLYRTEIPFMVRPDYPDVETQTEIYSEVLELAGDRPVVFRTLDVGGDKLLPYWRDAEEDNPAMGWRSIRIALDRPAMLRHQLRALLRASAGKSLHIIFPMIAEVAEFDAAHHILQLELRRARSQGQRMPIRVRVGVMMEVPSLFWQLETLFPKIDFLSVGSNDLFQFFFASDRGNPRMASRYDPLSPAGLRFLRALVSACEAAKVELSLCGEMAGSTVDALALLGVGFRKLSMTPLAVGPVKTMVRSLDLASLERYMDGFFELSGHAVREKLRGFAQDRGILL